MKLISLALAALLLFLASIFVAVAPASAGHYHFHRTHARHYVGQTGMGARPRAWCGWWMRTQLGGGERFNRAWEWRKWGVSSLPQIGAVVVWPHHVGMITGRTADGRWIVKSGNDGHRVRERARSVSGALFRARG